MQNKIHFFAASNSSRGFISLFDRLYTLRDGKRVYLIHGGPGTGKSSLMRKVAARLDAADLPFEYLHCSSDPDSLDGVICEQKGAVILDATPPHTVTPLANGVIENIVNVGAFWDRAKLRQSAEKVFALDTEMKVCFSEVYKLLGAAGKFKSYSNDIGLVALNDKKCSAYVRQVVKRLVPARESEKAKAGRQLDRFLSNVTPKGHIFYEETVRALADRVYVLRDDIGTAARCVLSAVKNAALEAGYDCYCCLCPLAPEKCEHLIIPELRLALITGNALHSMSGKTVDMSRYYDDTLIAANLNQLAAYTKKIASAVSAAVCQLQKIKALHDELEKIYIQAMDFDRVNALAAETVERFLGE